jgi:[acyl-carrier-protein] S-malonyltransferase
MRPAEDALRERIQRAQFATPRLPIVSSVSGRTESDAATLRSLLLRQITSPVRWVDVIGSLEAAGVSLAIEVGGGDILTGLGRRITDRIRFATYEEAIDGQL